jgi:hypothetical protein
MLKKGRRELLTSQSLRVDYVLVYEVPEGVRLQHGRSRGGRGRGGRGRGAWQVWVEWEEAFTL